MRAMRGLVTAMAAVLAMSDVPRAQTTAPAVDRLFRISGLLPGPAPAGTIAPVVLGIYDRDVDGAPLWQEVQTVTIGPGGLYTVLVGATSAEGVPPEVFATGEPRWLGITGQWPGAVEAPRTLLTSVPYAVHAARASDADALGGLPATAYLRVRGSGTPRAANAAVATSTPAGDPSRAADPLVNAGTTGRIGKFVSGTDLGDSVMTESGGRIGVGTTAPLDTMSVRLTDTSGAFTGYAVQNLGNTSTSYSGMLFYDQNGALGQFQGFNNATHEYRINNIASSGSINFMLNSASLFRVTSAGAFSDGGASNTGLTGTTASGAFRVAGLAGINTHPSAQSLGLLGQATASPIGTGVNGFGSITGGYFEATGSPSGGFLPTAVVGQAFGANGIGVVGRGLSKGMIAEAVLFGGIGIEATAVGGSAIKATGNAVQDRTSGGFVKIMAAVNSSGGLVRCYSAYSTQPSCGITVSHIGNGQYAMDLGVQIDDRFYMFQTQSIETAFSFGSGSSMTVVTSFNNTLSDVGFFVFVF